MEIIELFPSTLIEYRIDKEPLINLMKEIESHRDDMRLYSLARQEQDVSEYITDYPKNFPLPTFLEIFDSIKNDAFENGLVLELIQYWTAIYTGKGYHEKHNHRSNYLDKTNYSGILYLSDIGRTLLFSPNPTSIASSHRIQSEFGKIILFPSTVIHEVENHKQDMTERCVVAFNMEVTPR